MIFVAAERLNRHFSSPYSTENAILEALMDDATLASTATSFKSLNEKKISGTSTEEKYVYVFQKEYATIDPASVHMDLCKFVGTDEATTCVGVVLRNRRNGMISIAHMDSVDAVENGLDQMLLQLAGHDSNLELELDVHLIGGFDDALPNRENGVHGVHRKKERYSRPLCYKIIYALEKRPESFHIQTLFVLKFNTRVDATGIGMPIFHGFVVETSSGMVVPAIFDRTSRCPDEVVRRIRLCAANEDPRWKHRLLDTYDTCTDQFSITPCSLSYGLIRMASVLQNLSDSELINLCSTSPSAEGPYFVDNERRKWSYLLGQPNWLDTFPRNQSRIFRRTDGTWTMC